MTNKSKAKGTAAETRVVKYLNSFDGIRAERKALSGAEDKGDIKVIIFTDDGDDFEYIFEVKGGKQTINPNRSQLEEWLRQTEAEKKNAGTFRGFLVIARHGKSPDDYDVWERRENSRSLTHWYLDEWCKDFYWYKY